MDEGAHVVRTGLIYLAGVIASQVGKDIVRNAIVNGIAVNSTSSYVHAVDSLPPDRCWRLD